MFLSNRVFLAIVIHFLHNGTEPVYLTMNIADCYDANALIQFYPHFSFGKSKRDSQLSDGVGDQAFKVAGSGK